MVWYLFVVSNAAPSSTARSKEPTIHQSYHSSCMQLFFDQHRESEQNKGIIHVHGLP